MNEQDKKLRVAARAGDFAGVKEALAAGADVNAKNDYGYTALIWAARYGHTAVVEMLLSAGADVNAKNTADATALIEASRWGHMDSVKALLAAGADVNARDEDGNTALIEASSRWGNAAIVNVLLSAGAYMNAKDKYGETALIRASYLGRTDSVKALLSAGADVNAKDENGETVLMVARRLGYKDIADIIGTAIKRARRRANISRLNFRRICTFCLEKTFGFKHRPDTVEALSEENAELHEEVRELVKQVCQLGTLLDRENEGKPRKVCRWRIPNRGLAIPGCHFVYSPLCIPESLQAWQFCPLCGEAIQKIEEDK